MNYPSLLDTLTEQQQKVLALMACDGDSCGDSFVREAASILKTTQKAVKEDVQRLSKLALIEEAGRSMWSSGKEYTICPVYHFRMLCWLVDVHPDWMKSICKVMGDELAEDLLDIAQAWKAGTLDKIAQEDDFICDEEYLAEALCWVYDEGELLPFFRHINDDLLRAILDELLSVFEKELPIASLHRFLDTLVDGRKKGRMALLQDAYDYCRITEFINEGVYAETPKGESTERGLWMKAVHEAYARNTAEAVLYMEKALKMHNKSVTRYGEEKNVFSGYITNFFMMVIYAMDGSVAAKKKLEVACKKRSISESVNGAPSYVLGTYFKDSSMSIRTLELTRCLCKTTGQYENPDIRQLGFLLMKYFDLHPNKLQFNKYYEKPDLSPEQYIPVKALLRHELSPYIPISEEEKAHLRELFGGEPLLASIYRKKEWEVVLDELMELASLDSQKKQGETSATRIVYTIKSESEYMEVREQKRLKNGEWSKGKEFNATTYSRGDFEMDEIDRKIWEACKSSYYMPTASKALPHLVGCNRVQMAVYRSYTNSFYGYYENFDAEVREEKPFITVKRGDKGIVLQTNLPSLALLDKQLVYHLDKSTHIITYYPFTEKEKMYYRKLFSLKNIPLEAEEALKKLFPVISNHVAVHSDFIEGGAQLEQVEGQSLVTLRILPRSYGVYQLSLFVRPFEKSKQVFMPGQGQNPAFGDMDGNHVQIKRTMRMEKSNAQVFTDFLEEADVTVDNFQAELNTQQLLELMEFAREHSEEGLLEWPEGEKLKLAVAQPQTWSVSLKKNAGWFDLEGELSMDEDTILSIAHLLDLLGESHGRFIRLEGDKYLAISEQLRKQLQKLDAVASRQRGKAVVPVTGMAVLGEALSGELEIAHPKSLDDLRTKIKKSARLNPEVPERLNATLRDYQVDGFQWMTRLASWGAGACLADDMGLGKTIQTIAVLLDKAEQGPSLVVAPASVVPNWSKEIRRFAPTLTVSILNEAPDRKQLIEEGGAAHVVISTYGLLVTEEGLLTQKQWNVICLDEAHSIKNRDTKTSASAMKLEGQQRIILTGTPIQNHLGELWNLFQFINPGLLGPYEQFQKKYILPISQDHDTQRQQQLKRLVAPFMLRRTKQEVVEELPDKTEVTRTVQLSDEEMAVYEVIRRKAKKELEELEASGKALNINALAEITKLRQCACSASLVKKGFAGSTIAKLDAFEELVSNIYQTGNCTLVFSQFTSFLELAAKRLDQQKIPYFYLDGSTPMRKRTQMVEAFQKGERPVFLISLKAGGLGLNLTGANYVIHLDPWWNPAIEQQATDRAYRIGQRQNVTVYHLISANTIEEKILRLHDAKRDLATSILEGTDTSHKITAAQLLKMIEEG